MSFVTGDVDVFYVISDEFWLQPSIEKRRSHELVGHRSGCQKLSLRSTQVELSLVKG